MSRVRGNKWKELIDKWLSGEEDEEYEVRPTKTEGKFIVKKRVSQRDEVHESKSIEETREEECDERNSGKPLHNNKSWLDQSTSLQILEQLRFLGEK